MPQEEVVDLRWLFSVVRRWWWLIVTCVGVGITSAWMITAQLPPVYEASATLLIHVSNMSDYTAIITSERLALTYSEMITGRSVLAEVISQLKLKEKPEELVKRVTVTPIEETQLVRLTVQNNDPVRAAMLANTIAETFIQQIGDLGRRRLAFRTDVVLVEPAQVPQQPVRNQILYVALAGLVSAMLSIGMVFLFEYLDDTVRTPENVSQAVGLATLATVGRRAKGEQELIVTTQPRSYIAEAYYTLRTNIRFANVSKPLRILLVTSPEPLEGKSVTVANLAAAMAQEGVKVVLVDADLRRPRLHQLFGLDVPRGSQPQQPRWGLTGALIAGNTHNLLHSTRVNGLKVLPSGELPPNPAEIVGSESLRQLLQGLAQQADVVLIDSPPVLPVSDAAALAQAADGVLLVLKAGHTRLETAQQAVARLQQVDAYLVGVVLNGIHVHRRGYYYYSAPRRAGDDNFGRDQTALPGKRLAGLRRFLEKKYQA